MDNRNENQESISFMPVIPRLDRLDRLIQLLEEKHSLSKRDFSDRSFGSIMAKDDEFKSMSSALEEVEHKGTLVERLTVLENRVLQLGLEMDEENTSKSSSSTVQVSELPIPKKVDENVSISRKEMQDPLVKLHEGADGFMEESKGHKGKTKRKWFGLFRIRLTC